MVPDQTHYPEYLTKRDAKTRKRSSTAQTDATAEAEEASIEAAKIISQAPEASTWVQKIPKPIPSAQITGSGPSV